MCPLSLADAVHPEGTPWILPRLDPGTGPLFTLFAAFLFGPYILSTTVAERGTPSRARNWALV